MNSKLLSWEEIEILYADEISQEVTTRTDGLNREIGLLNDKIGWLNSEIEDLSNEIGDSSYEIDDLS